MMTTPIFFPRLLVLALAGAVFCLPHAASAQHAPEVSFHPAKSWFNSQNDVNGTPYCTLENEFNNGFILKFDGA